MEATEKGVLRTARGSYTKNSNIVDARGMFLTSTASSMSMKQASSAPGAHTPPTKPYLLWSCNWQSAGERYVASKQHQSRPNFKCSNFSTQTIYQINALQSPGHIIIYGWIWIDMAETFGKQRFSEYGFTLKRWSRRLQFSRITSSHISATAGHGMLIPCRSSSLVLMSPRMPNLGGRMLKMVEHGSTRHNSFAYCILMLSLGTV